jgi:hypothetical protein
MVDADGAQFGVVMAFFFEAAFQKKFLSLIHFFAFRFENT